MLKSRDNFFFSHSLVTLLQTFIKLVLKHYKRQRDKHYKAPKRLA